MDSRLHALLLFCLTLTVAPLARSADQCSLDGLNLCQALDGKSDRISFSDGTFVPNPNVFKTPGTNLAKLRDQENARSGDNVGAALETQIKISHLLEKTSPLMGEKARFYFMANGAQLKEALTDPTMKYNVPWPLTGASKMQIVDGAQVSAALKKMMTPADQQTAILIADQFKDDANDRAAHVDADFTGSGGKLMNDLQTVSDKRYARVKELFAYAKSAIEKELLAGRKIEQLSDVEKAAIAKVDAVEFNDDQGDISANPDCLGLKPNAFYMPAAHNVSICPNLMNFPDASLIRVLGHELTHSIDSCYGQFALYKVNQDLLAHLRWTPDVESNDDHFRAVSMVLGESMHSNLSATRFSPALSPSQLDYLKGSGAVKVLTPDVPFDHYVLKDAYDCLSSARGGDFVRESNDDGKKMVNDIVGYRKATGGKSYDATHDRKAIADAIAKNPECGWTGAHSQMSETMADWMGSRVQAEFLSDPKQNVPKDRMAVLGELAYDSCTERSDPQQQTSKTSIALLQNAQGDQEAANDVHPASIKRLETLTLRNPTVRTAAGCSPAGAAAPFCAHHPQTSAKPGPKAVLPTGKVAE